MTSPPRLLGKMESLWPSLRVSSGASDEFDSRDGDRVAARGEGRRARGKDEVCLGWPLPAFYLGLFGGMMLTVTHPLTSGFESYPF